MKRKRKRYNIRKRRLAFSLSIFCILSLLAINGLISFFYGKSSSSDNALLVKSQQNKVTAVKSKPNLVVCIDPGHGAYDPGALSENGIYEKNVTLAVGLKLGQILEKNNIKVVYTRKDDKTILGSSDKEDLRKRVQISDENNADIFVSIHCNSYDDSSVKGIELWCKEPNSKGEELAKCIENELYNLNYTEKRGIKYQKDSALYVLKNNKAVSTLVEIGYLTNGSDSAFITSKSGQTKCAEAIAKAILEVKK